MALTKRKSWCLLSILASKSQELESFELTEDKHFHKRSMGSKEGITVEDEAVEHRCGFHNGHRHRPHISTPRKRRIGRREPSFARRVIVPVSLVPVSF